MTAMDDAIRGLKETGASVSDRDLVHLLALHEAEEGSVLARFGRFVDLVAGLLMMDTAKHIRILRFLIEHADKRHGWP